MLVLISAKSGNAAYSQPSNRLLAVDTANTATAVAVARLWAATQSAIATSKNEITITVAGDGDNVHAERP